MIGKSYYKFAKTNLERIVKVNSYIDDIRRVIPIDTNIDLLIEENSKAKGILSKLHSSANVENLDRYIAFWIYETCTSPNDRTRSYNAIFSKLKELQLKTRKNAREQLSTFDFTPIKQLLLEESKLKEKYSLEYDDVVILTAVPVEFKAMIRKISIIVRVFDRYETRRIVNPETSQESLKKRKKTWVEGVIVRNNKWVKVRLVLTKEYGSVAAMDALNDIEDEYNYPKELLIVGVAGQLDETEKVKIGDLVISDSYFNAYLLKDIETPYEENTFSNDISYNDCDSKELSDDYKIKKKFNWKKWTPSKMLTPMPSTKDKKNFPQNQDFSKEHSFRGLQL